MTTNCYVVGTGEIGTTKSIGETHRFPFETENSFRTIEVKRKVVNRSLFEFSYSGLSFGRPPTDRFQKSEDVLVFLLYEEKGTTYNVRDRPTLRTTRRRET